MKYLKQENIYSLIWCLYYMQGILFAEGSIISQGLLAVFLLMSLYYFVKVSQIRSVNKVIRAFQYLAIMFGVYGLIRFTVDTHGWVYINEPTTYFKEYELSILPIFAFYYYAKSGRINSKWFFKISLFFIITAIATFYKNEAKAILSLGSDEITNNAGYFVVSLLPIVVFLKKKPLYQYAALFLIFFYVVQGMKRGAIIVVVIGCGYFVWESYKNAKGNKKFLYILLGLVVVIAGVMYFQYQLENSDYMKLRLERTMEGDMSERENMYPDYLDFYFNNATTAEYLLGYGADGTLRNMGEFAHEDWIETLMNQGFLGIILLLNYWLTIFYVTIKSYQKKYTNITLILALFIIIYFTKSLVSMSINGMTIFSTSALAYALAAMDNPFIRKDLTDK